MTTNRTNRPRIKGFTLVELLVATLLLSVGVLALVSTAIATTRQIEFAFAQVQAKALATRNIERLRTEPCPAPDRLEGLRHVAVVIEHQTAPRVSADTFYATIPC